MKHHSMRPGIWSGRLLAGLIVSVAVLVGGCQSQAPPLSSEAQTVKKALLREMGKLTTALAEPVAEQDWEASKPILAASAEEMQKSGRTTGIYLAVLDRNGIMKDRFPPKKVEHLDFRNYGPAQTVFQEKKTAQAMLYLGGSKIFVLMAPLLKDNQVVGSVALGFTEEDLERWKVPEKEFLSINFNQ
jgi:hypothetical protein